MTIELADYIRAFRRWWWLILLSVVMSTGSSWLAVRNQPLSYQARVRMMVGQGLLEQQPSEGEFVLGKYLTLSYSEIAARIGAPKAARAVARACASNRLAVAIPCHRAVRSDGGLGGYRWGLDRKEAILERESA